MFHTCNCCLVRMYGVYFSCTTCFDDTGLCFKCYGSKEAVHPQHDLKEEGYEWDELANATSDVPGSADGRDPDDGQDQQDFMGDFDDEIVGDDDGSIVAGTEASATAGDEIATVTSLTSTRPIGSVRARIGAHR